MEAQLINSRSGRSSAIVDSMSSRLSVFFDTVLPSSREHALEITRVIDRAPHGPCCFHLYLHCNVSVSCSSSRNRPEEPAEVGLNGWRNSADKVAECGPSREPAGRGR